MLYWESSKVRVTIRVELSNIGDCDEIFDLRLTDDGVGIDVTEDGGLNMASSFER